MAKKESALRIRVEESLHQAFLRACRAEDIPASQVIRHFMRRYVDEHQYAAQQSLFEDQQLKAGNE